MDPTQIDAILTVLRRHGVTEFSQGDLSVRLAPPAPPQSKQQPTADDFARELTGGSFVPNDLG